MRVQLLQQRRSIWLLVCSAAASKRSAPHRAKRTRRTSRRVLLQTQCALLPPTPVMKRGIHHQHANLLKRVVSLLPQPACSEQLCAYTLAPTDAALQEGADCCGGRRRKAFGRYDRVAGATLAISICERTSCCSRDTQHLPLLGRPQQTKRPRHPVKRSPKCVSRPSSRDEA